MPANSLHPVARSAAALSILLLAASAALAQQHGFGTLTAVGEGKPPKGSSVAVRAEEFTDANTRLSAVIEQALKTRGYQVDPNAETVLSFDTEMSDRTDPLPGGGGFEEASPETLLEAPPPDTEMGESLADEDQELSFGEPSIALGHGGGGGGGAEYSLTFTLGSQGGVPSWQGSLTAVLDQQGAFEVARSMVPPLVDHIGASAKAERVPLRLTGSAMRLSDHERRMRAGEAGEPRRWAIEQQIAVGEFFDAEDLVAVNQVHLCADTEALGPSGVLFLERCAGAPADQRRVAVPTVTDPRGTDFQRFGQIRHPQWIVELERRAADALAALGMLLTDTCINYQSVLPPVKGEHLAFGDTGSVIYANSVCGARSNYEGGPAALAAALTGRTPRYGFHLDPCRRGSQRYRIADPPRSLSDWGALGALIGREQPSYWQVPIVEAASGGGPNSDALKHFGAAMASWGSTAMYHVCGVTPEAPDADPTAAATSFGHAEIDAFYAGFAPSTDQLDVVVFAAPQLSLLEMQQLAALLDGKRVHGSTALLVATSPEIRHAALRLGLVAAIERAGGVVLEGVCFYQMHARVLAEANGWRTLMTNSAKLVNIIAGYGYEPVLAPMARCVQSATAGRIQR